MSSAKHGQAKSANGVSTLCVLLEAARASKINPSATLEQAQRRQWREENREAIAAYNRHVDKHGVFAGSSRSF